MFVKLLLVLLPAATYSIIQVKIAPMGVKKIVLSGTSLSVIDDIAKAAFEIDEKEFLKASAKIMGKQCKDIFFTAATRWGNVYEKFGWEQVQLEIVPIRGQVLSIDYGKRIVLDKARYENKNSKPKNVQIKLSYDVPLGAGHHWATDELQSQEEIKYVLDFDLGSVWSYTAPVGVNFAINRKVTIGKKFNVTVPPHSVKVAEVAANEAKMIAVVKYKATLVGDVFCNYEEKYKGHHFYRIDISDFQEILDTPITVETEQEMSIQFYANIKYNVFN